MEGVRWPKRCRRCVYRGPDRGENGCDYLYFTGSSRRCPVGDECTKFVEGERLHKGVELPEDGRSEEEKAVDLYRARGYKQERMKY